IELFGDAQHVFYSEIRHDGFGPGRALRAQDGVSVPLPEFAGLLPKRLRVHDGALLVSDAGADGLRLRLYDVASGKDLWEGSFPVKSLVLKSEDRDLAGVVAPDGTLTVVDLAARREMLRSRVDPADLDKVNEGLLLKDAGLCYVILNRPPEDNANQALRGPFP